MRLPGMVYFMAKQGQLPLVAESLLQTALGLQNTRTCGGKRIIYHN